MTPAVLFVCLGNICRSPLAEAAFRHHAALKGLAAEADSAGTAAYHAGNPPDPRSISTAIYHGIDISHYRARQIEQTDFTRFTHIFALDEDNLANIRRIAPAHSTAQIALLMDLVPGREGQAVADPYYGDAAGFETSWQEVSEAARHLVRCLA
ncbi:MAG: low molecular weight protein-tyrosine-phosphatase [Sphingomonadaceae bacterium]|nr:low molecular weight phosphotyrosine protein phosphatase [Sphingomonadaceae bacterium]